MIPVAVQQTSTQPRIRSVIGLVALLAALTLPGLAGGAAQAQLVIDNTTFSSADGTTLSYAHTVSPGANRLLMVGVEVHAHTTVKSVEWGTGSTCGSACDPAHCMCSLTQVASKGDNNNAVTVQLWKLVNPPEGTGNVVVSLLSNHRMISGATSFLGVDPHTPLGTAAKNSADSGGSAAVEVSGTSGGIVLDAVGTTYDESLAVAGPGQTQQYLASVSAGSGAAEGVAGGGSTAPAAASLVVSWRLSSPSWAIVAVSVNPGPPAPTPTGAPPTPTASPTATPAVPACVGDCDGSGDVTVDELVLMVKIALGDVPLAECIAGDADGSGDITIDEIIAAVNHALTACPM